MQLLHISLTEYIAVFSSPFSAIGRGGRYCIIDKSIVLFFLGLHWSNSTCTVLSGVVERTEDRTTVTANKENFKAGV